MSKKRAAPSGPQNSAAARFGDDLASVLAQTVAGYAGPPATTTLSFFRWDEDKDGPNGATSRPTRHYIASKSGGVLKVVDCLQGTKSSMACSTQAAELVGESFRLCALEDDVNQSCIEWALLGVKCSARAHNSNNVVWTAEASAIVAAWVRAPGDVA